VKCGLSAGKNIPMLARKKGQIGRASEKEPMGFIDIPGGPQAIGIHGQRSSRK